MGAGALRTGSRQVGIMIRLCGFPVSNYYNKVKLVLLEKGLAFEEEFVGLGRAFPRLDASPARKIPFLEDAGATIVESQPIVEYLEDTYPQVPLMPADPIARARCRELITIVELYLEWPARRLYPQAFFGGTVSEETRADVAKELARGLAAFTRLAQFSPYVGGEQLTVADCAIAMHLPLIALATERVLGTNVLAELEPVKPWLERLAARPSFERVAAERKAGEAAMAARRAARERQAKEN